MFLIQRVEIDGKDLILQVTPPQGWDLHASLAEIASRTPTFLRLSKDPSESQVYVLMRKDEEGQQPVAVTLDEELALAVSSAALRDSTNGAHFYTQQVNLIAPAHVLGGLQPLVCTSSLRPIEIILQDPCRKYTITLRPGADGYLHSSIRRMPPTKAEEWVALFYRGRPIIDIVVELSHHLAKTACYDGLVEKQDEQNFANKLIEILASYVKLLCNPD